MQNRQEQGFNGRFFDDRFDLFTTRVLLYVRNGTASGKYEELHRISKLTNLEQETLAYKIKVFLDSEAKYPWRNYIFSFFIDAPVNCAARAAVIFGEMKPINVKNAEEMFIINKTPFHPSDYIF